MSYMYKEILSVPQVIKEQLQHYLDIMPSIIAAIHDFSPQFIVTVARGSSDHAASFAKYIFETQLALVTSSFAPSVETIYKADLQVKSALVVAFSQSGKSPDLCEVLSAAKKGGALTLAFVNKTDSPLAAIADYVIPLSAGEEISVAATKSFIATLSAILAFTAYWKKDQDLLEKLAHLPHVFLSEDFVSQKVIEDMAKRQDMLILGRGFTFPIAQEAALKLKETCKLHAEAFSLAEVLHGPFALMAKNFPLIIFAPTDAAKVGLSELLERLSQIDACVYLLIPNDHINNIIPHENIRILSLPPSLHVLCDPLIAIHAFYLMAEKCAQIRHINPDKPDHLSKVTCTR